MIMNGCQAIFKKAKYVIQEVNLERDELFPDMPSEVDMDDYMRNLGFKNNEVIDIKNNSGQIDKIYF